MLFRSVTHIPTFIHSYYGIKEWNYGYNETSKQKTIYEPYILPNEKHYQDSFEDYLEDFNRRFYEDVAYYEPEPDIEQYDDERGIDIEFD